MIRLHINTVAHQEGASRNVTAFINVLFLRLFKLM